MATEERLTNSELKRMLSKARAKVQLGALYQHIHGGYYVVRSVSLRESDLEPLVSYAPLTSAMIEFSRPLTEFLDRFEQKKKG
jgi:hypothetical protein